LDKKDEKKKGQKRSKGKNLGRKAGRMWNYNFEPRKNVANLGACKSQRLYRTVRT